jgi:hypoxia up-regulated 1
MYITISLVQVDYTREIVNENDKTVQSKTVKSALFGPMNAYPQKKVMSFRKHVDDFTFYVNYGDLSHLPKEDVLNLGPLNITEVKVTGIADAVKKNTAGLPDGVHVDTKGVKAHFLLDESGVVRLTAAEFVFEKTENKREEPEESPLSKLGSTISAFFGGGKEEPEAGSENDGTQSAENKGEEGSEKKVDEKDAGGAKNDTAGASGNSTEAKSTNGTATDG